MTEVGFEPTPTKRLELNLKLRYCSSYGWIYVSVFHTKQGSTGFNFIEFTETTSAKFDEYNEILFYRILVVFLDENLTKMAKCNSPRATTV